MRSLTSKVMVLFTILAMLISIAPMAPIAMAQDSDTATVTVVHNIESVPPVDVYANEVANGTAVINALPFGESVTLDVPAGDYTFFVTPAGALAPILLEGSFSLEAGEAYTVEATLDADGTPVLAAVVPVEEPTTDATEVPAELPTILEIATGSEDFSTLVTAVETAGEPVTSLLSGDGPITVFAPTNAAFEALPPGVLDAVLASPPSLIGVLGAHVVEDLVTLEDLTDGATFNSFIGFPLTVTVDEDGNVLLNETVAVSTTEVAASNGNVIVIDAVIVPPRPDEGPTADATEEPVADATEEPVADATEEPVADATEEPMAEMGNIREVADAAGDLGFLGTAVDTFGVGDVLTQDGPITVFAPTDDAFNANLTALLDLANDPAVGVQTLQYHIVDGLYTAADVLALAEEGGSLETLAGESITFAVVDDAIVVNGTATIVATDLMASNGIVHKLDNVLFLPAAEEPIVEATEEPMAEMTPEATEVVAVAEATEEPVVEATEEPMAEMTPEATEVVAVAEATEEPVVEATEEPVAELGDIRAVTDAAGDLNFFGTAVDTFAVGSLLTQTDQALTVFVPNDDAFNAQLSALMELANDPVVGVAALQHHVVAGVYTAEDVIALAESGTPLVSLAGTPLNFALVDGNVVINGEATIYATDLAASNGIVHKIDFVMALPTIVDTLGGYNANQTADAEDPASLPTFNTLVLAVETAGEPVTTTLGNRGITVFAPTDAAFAALPPGVLDSVISSPPSLQGVLGAHVVEDRITAADLTDGAMFPTSIGFPLTVSVDEDGNVTLLDGTINVVSVITAANGNIIVIDGVIVPPRPGSEDGAPEGAAPEATEAATEAPAS